MVVGGVNTVFGYGCFWLLLYVGLHYSMALLIGTVLGVLFNFKTTGTLVFGSHDNRLIFRFVGSYVFTYFCNLAGLRVLVGAGFSPQVGGLLLILPMAAVSFVILRRFVFAAKT
ncbi:GtrA family protein [Ramlibacter sp. GTP1]|uniref:GtrA family protein n=1 Tax=Ramlibacter albus TaxID=2079448 RepID=A0A923S1F6_9BURK|nr:GtrA family protein [Ramlibacter albus]